MEVSSRIYSKQNADSTRTFMRFWNSHLVSLHHANHLHVPLVTFNSFLFMLHLCIF